MTEDYVSAIPDAHLGKGVSIGTVFVSEEYFFPNAVSPDVGCGVAVVPIEDLYKWELSGKDLWRMQNKIKDRMSTGFEHYRKRLKGS